MIFVQDFLADIPNAQVKKIKAILDYPEANLRIFKEPFDDSMNDNNAEIHVFSNLYVNIPIQVHPFNSEADIRRMVKIILTNDYYHVPNTLLPILPPFMIQHDELVLMDGLESISNIVNGTIQEFQNCSLDREMSQKLFKFFEKDQ